MNELIQKIRAVVMDVDGVLTDGRIIYDSAGEEIKFFDVQDGYGITLLHKVGIRTAIISARAAKPVEFRARDLKIDKLYQNAYPKIAAFEQMLADLRVRREEVCFIGDDVPDVEVIKAAGFGVAVANAGDDAKSAAVYVTKKSGGRGAVREVIELILKTQHKWEEATQSAYRSVDPIA